MHFFDFDLSQDLVTYIQNFCASNQSNMLRLLEKAVCINSYTWNKKGAESVAALFEAELGDLGMHIDKHKHRQVGDTLVARTQAAVQKDHKCLLYCGHLDTVFPPEMNFSCFEQYSDHIRGPGVIDMKGGLVAAVYALKALQAMDLLHTMPVTFVINADEEVGSPFSTPVIELEAAKSAVAFVFECSGLAGEAVVSRKGKLGCTVTCTGRAGHVGQADSQKPSAIAALAHTIIELEKLNAPERSITCNVGTISGGTSPNTVPETAEAAVDCRCATLEDLALLEKNIQEIVKASPIPGVVIRAEIKSKRSPMAQSPASQKLFSVVAQCAHTLELPFSAETRGGVSDANTIAALNVPVLDGLGPSGDCDHSSREYMLTHSLHQRSALATLATLAAAKEFL